MGAGNAPIAAYEVTAGLPGDLTMVDLKFTKYCVSKMKFSSNFAKEKKI